MKSTFLILRLYIFGVYTSLTFGTKCGQSEYLSAANECCPMCLIGSVVLKDCYGDYSTTCKPCFQGTFMNEPNGLYKCFPCKTCDSGLYILHDCTAIKDTVCDVLDGYYCINDLNKTKECSVAMKHSQCKPGEKIKTPGTKSLDTACEPCPTGFYSPDGVTCSKTTDSLENKPDVRKPRTWYMRYGLLPAVLLLSVVALCSSSTFNYCMTLKKPVEETYLDVSVLTPSSSHLEKLEESPVGQPDCDRAHGACDNINTAYLL